MATRYFFDITHEALGRSRRVTGPDRLVVEERVRLQLAAWERQWQRVQWARDENIERERQARIDKREQALQDRQDKKEQAAQETREAQAALQALDELLSHTLTVDDRIDWEAMKDRSKFSTPKPQPHTSLPLPAEPNPQEPRFQPELSLLDKVVPSRRASKEHGARVAFISAHDAWKREVARVTQRNTEAKEAFEKASAEWEKEREAFAVAKKTQHEQIDARRTAYEAGDPAAILDYCELVLSNSQYPDWITPDFETEYTPQTKTLIVEYELPRFDDLPRRKEVRYVQSRDEFDEVQLPENDRHETLRLARVPDCPPLHP